MTVSRDTVPYYKQQSHRMLQPTAKHAFCIGVVFGYCLADQAGHSPYVNETISATCVLQLAVYVTALTKGQDWAAKSRLPVYTVLGCDLLIQLGRKEVWTLTSRFKLKLKENLVLGRVPATPRPVSNSIFDANSVQSPPGIHGAKVSWTGAYEQCMSVQPTKTPVPVGQYTLYHDFNAKYCRTFYTADKVEFSFTNCVPEGCSDEDVQTILSIPAIFGSDGGAPSMKCGCYEVNVELGEEFEQRCICTIVRTLVFDRSYYLTCAFEILNSQCKQGMALPSQWMDRWMGVKFY
ncbi:hypothetical protein CAPTEDRAFT_202157 [Capitella teleta]|uniref:Nose resistant-to-fluoxetine protein N-terminal domain-containing protein n=1 Tax=Capitella teleta TaxID=283909 RepID=R7U3P6_CAPTE|nr:hypothetical protein CAPTEDRAFT_202157 [Capitella teleta]|eukprot:ELU00761.1 hypothetical protein CAPTEDRAFT_202157 [Capitella teleta]